MRLQHYLNGAWQDGAGEGAVLFDPTNGEELARTSGDGLDLSAALDFARREGGSALRALSYAERGAMLVRIGEVLTANRDRYYEISLKNSGSTQADAAFDVDGGIGTVKYYAGLSRKLGDARYLMEPGADRLGKDENFLTAHILTPRPGVAVHINAFNFPSWGLWEKAAVALLSGVAVFAKPAAATAWLSHEMVKDVIDADILPKGALSLLCAGGRELMGLVQPGDVVAFTGSADTAAKLKGHPNIIASGVPFNVEADSLNAAILGPDAGPDSDEFQAMIKEVHRELTLKAGQKCTATRRIMIAAEQMDAVQAALVERLGKTAVGDPRDGSVRMGPLVNKAQQSAAWDGLAALKREAKSVYGGNEAFELVGADADTGAFFPLTLLRCDDPEGARAVHSVEVFGPVATLMPYTDPAQAFYLAARGEGSLVTSVYTADDGFAAQAALNMAAWHGRLVLVDGRVAKSNPGHGTVMPQSVHGGPGRAGGGEELGGPRGLAFYHQRTAVWGHSDRLEALRGNAAAYPG